MASHQFTFEGGDLLTGIGASWFVSYAYFETVDRSHRNWEKVSTANTRLTKYVKGRPYHRTWLQEVLAMSPDRLNKNTIGLDANQIKTMAREILAHLDEHTPKEDSPQPETSADPSWREEKLKFFDHYLWVDSYFAYQEVKVVGLDTRDIMISEPVT